MDLIIYVVIHTYLDYGKTTAGVWEINLFKIHPTFFMSLPITENCLIIKSGEHTLPSCVPKSQIKPKRNYQNTFHPNSYIIIY